MATRQDKDLNSFTDFGDGTFARNVVLKNDLLGDVVWDYVAQTVGATTDTWTFRNGGSGGTITGVVVITYTDSTKGTIDHVERTT